MNAVKKLALFVSLFLLSDLHAGQGGGDKAHLYSELQNLVGATKHVNEIIYNGIDDPAIWAKRFNESPEVIDEYIKSGHHMPEIVSHILGGATYDPKGAAYYCLRDYIWTFSFNLAYYDPVLSEEKKREAAQAIIYALRARPVGGTEDSIGTQSYPLVALGYFYLFSPWRHRPEVIEYAKTVEFTDHIDFNKDRVAQLVRLHEGAIQERGSLPIPWPGPGKVFPVHPAARAQAEAAAQAEQEQKNTIPAPYAAPAPSPAPPPPAASAPAPSPAAPSAKPSRAAWWILGVLAALGTVVVVTRKKKAGH